MASSTPPADFLARIGRLEGIVEQMDERMASLEQRMAALEQRMAALEQRMGNLESGQRQGFFWIVGIQITTLLTLGTLILVKLG